MGQDTQNKKRGACGAFMGLVFLGVLIFGLFLGFLPKNVYGAGWGDYYDVISFSGDVADNSAILTIQVKTTFQLQYTKPSDAWFCNSGYYGQNKNLFTIRDTGTGDSYGVIDIYTIKKNGVLVYTDKWTCPSPIFEAGFTYEFKLTSNVHDYIGYGRGVYMREYYDIFGKGWFYLDVGDYVNKLFEYSNLPVLFNPFIYYYLPVPTIQITFPTENSEIAEAFYIQGSYDAKSLELYPKIYIWLQHIGLDIYPFVKSLTSITGNLNERISGVPVGDYQIRFLFGGGEGGLFEIPDKVSIKIVDTIPYELPITREVWPEVPFFSALSAKKIYEDYSNYPTSTPMFNVITGAIEPLIITIGDNLTFFSSQFKVVNAKEAGEKAGEAVLVIRANAGIINSFFNDLPIAEILFLYLSALVVVIVFRIIRQLLKLIPFT